MLFIPINLDAVMTEFSRAVGNKKYDRLAYTAWSDPRPVGISSHKIIYADLPTGAAI